MSGSIITGTCVCPGVVRGKVKRFAVGVTYTKSDIVLLEEWLTHEVLALKDAGALLSATGGITSHASIIARELEIPSLIGVDITQLQEGQEVHVDTAEEKVEVLL